MQIIRNSSEAEMILAFLQGELQSKRFSEKIKNALADLNLNSDIIIYGNINAEYENKKRAFLMQKFRGYPDKELFNNFPKNIDWKYAKLAKNDINNIYYINYSYWNELSGGTSKPLDAAKTIKMGKEIFGVSNKPFISGADYIINHKFPPVILLTYNTEKYVIIEGHSRMTVYGLLPEKIEGSYAYIGFVSKEEMELYDKRML
ncbi:MAG: hypothetical protein MJ113_00030 [Lachnospiraceae bacterium]|nr:hypothetical protein [Lachnospiraceae bacterium]